MNQHARVIPLMFLLMIISTSVIYAHGDQLVIPLSADVVVIIACIILMFKHRTGWKYRIAIFIGTVLTLYISGVIYSWIFKYYYHELFGTLFSMTLVFYAVNIILFALVYILAEKHVKNKPENN